MLHFRPKLAVNQYIDRVWLKPHFKLHVSDCDNLEYKSSVVLLSAVHF